MIRTYTNFTYRLRIREKLQCRDVIYFQSTKNHPHFRKVREITPTALMNMSTAPYNTLAKIIIIQCNIIRRFATETSLSTSYSVLSERQTINYFSMKKLFDVSSDVDLNRCNSFI